MTDGVVTRALQKLEKNTQITRSIDSTNQRKKRIKITPEGRALAEKLRKIEDSWEKEVWKFLNTNELEEFKETLQTASLISLKEEKNI